jgi:hypothetical protein
VTSFSVAYTELVRQAAAHYLSLTKLVYLILSIFSSVFEYGFCKAPGEDDSDEGDGEEAG